MAHLDPVSSDDDAPEAVSHSISKRNAKQEKKTLRDFEAEENARKKAYNRERDRKLKERAIVTRLGKLSDNVMRKGNRKAQRESNVESDGSSGQEDEISMANTLEVRMRRAMEDAAAEMDEGDDAIGDGELENLTDGGSGDSGIDEEMVDNAESEPEEDEEMASDNKDESEDEDRPPLTKSSAKGRYLEDALFASAFASQSAHALAEITATKSLQKVQPSRKRQRRPLARAKDLLVGCASRLSCCELSDRSTTELVLSVPYPIHMGPKSIQQLTLSHHKKYANLSIGALLLKVGWRLIKQKDEDGRDGQVSRVLILLSLIRIKIQ
jgi:hypothetical protein